MDTHRAHHDTPLEVPIDALIDAHVASVIRTMTSGFAGGGRQVDPAALRCVLRRQADVLIRMGYARDELALLPEDFEWWATQVVPISVMSDQPHSSHDEP